MERGAILERTKMTVELKGDKEKHTASTQPCPSTVAPPRPSAPQPIIKPKPVPPTTAAPKSAQPRPTAPSSSAAAQNIIRTAAPTPQPTNKPNTDTKPTATSQPTQKSSIPAAAPASPPDNYTEPPPTIEMKVYLESAAAGFGNYLSESTFDLIPFPENEVPPRADFGVRISGDSMEPTIPNNSIAWIEATPQIENGQIGIFVLNNEAFCKELSIDQENKTAYLISHNGKYKTIEIKLQDNCRTIGRVLFQG
jgi:phage repressor protein C with HTH and peptisase S24 domain